jgi:hypothetical protein
MTHWNYRVIKRQDESFGIHEVYYDENGDPTMCTADPVTLYGDSVDEIVNDVNHILHALNKPVLIDSEQTWAWDDE